MLGVLAAVAGAVLVADYRTWELSALHNEEDPRYLDVPAGSSFKTIVWLLVDEGLVDRPRYFEFMARQRGDAGRIQSGEYNVPPGIRPAELLDRLVRGQVIQYSFTIIEGWTFNQLRVALKADPRVLDTLSDVDDEDVMAALGQEGVHPEGRFYPDTYSFTRGTRDIDVLRRAFGAMERELENAWSERTDGLPIADPYEALILASIIEKETGLGSERRTIAGVFSRRLQQNMRLQTDPTVIYGMGNSYEGRIRTRDLRTDTPYNTYTRRGLPPTPIAMPGRASLRAAVDPEPGDALYFVSRGDGSHHFSATYEEHRKAVQRYILGRNE